MCTYNGSRYLAEQLRSIHTQTVLPQELVICDDRSTDNTAAIIQEFAQTAPFPVRFYPNEQTLRPAQNFARCLALCRGDILILTDQDDVWFPYRVADTVEAFAQQPELTFTYSECPLIDSEGCELPRTIYSSLPVSAADRRRLHHGTTLLSVLLRWGVLYGTTMALRGDLRRLCLPIPSLWSHDEWIGLVLSAVGPSARMPRPVTHYRQHAAQQVGTGDWTLGTHFGLAQEHGGEFYLRELGRFEQAIAAAEAHPELQKHLLPALLRKRLFLRDRLDVQNGGLRKLPRFLSMLLRGDYHRFSAGLRSPVKDLAMLLGGYAPARTTANP